MPLKININLPDLDVVLTTKDEVHDAIKDYNKKIDRAESNVYRLGKDILAKRKDVRAKAATLAAKIEELEDAFEAEANETNLAIQKLEVKVRANTSAIVEATGLIEKLQGVLGTSSEG